MRVRQANSLFLTAGLALTLIVGACERSGGVAIALKSPRDTYDVKLIGRLSAPSIPIAEHRVRLTATRGNVPVVEGFEVHFADWFDGGFEDDYGRPDWPLENALRFPSTSTQAKADADSVLVENKSRRVVPFLKVECGDLFLLFELQPGSLTSFTATPQTAAGMERSWIDAEGEWQRGARMKGEARNFPVAAGVRAYAYRVTISDQGIAVAQASVR